MRFNWSVNTDPQLREAASPRTLRSGYLQLTLYRFHIHQS